MKPIVSKPKHLKGGWVRVGGLELNGCKKESKGHLEKDLSLTRRHPCNRMGQLESEQGRHKVEFKVKTIFTLRKKKPTGSATALSKNEARRGHRVFLPRLLVAPLSLTSS